jgi:hypothetical protein
MSWPTQEVRVRPGELELGGACHHFYKADLRRGQAIGSPKTIFDLMLTLLTNFNMR